VIVVLVIIESISILFPLSNTDLLEFSALPNPVKSLITDHQLTDLI